MRHSSRIEALHLPLPSLSLKVSPVSVQLHEGMKLIGSTSIGARAGGKQLLAVADEEGSINLIDTDKDNQWDSGASPPLSS